MSEKRSKCLRQSVKDDGEGRKYFAQIPNIIGALGLSPFELTLYYHLKRTTGADPAGVCWKSTRTLAEEARMSVGMVAKAKAGLAAPRAELGGKSLILIDEDDEGAGRPGHCITLTDIWPENMAHFAGSNTSQSSPHELQSSPHELQSSPHEQKNNKRRRTPEEEGRARASTDFSAHASQKKDARAREKSPEEIYRRMMSSDEAFEEPGGTR